jgi:hypothetical protein
MVQFSPYFQSNYIPAADLLEGNDEPLRTMLIASAPRMRKAMFIAYDPWQEHDRFQGRHPLTFMCLAIHRIAHSPSPAWPVGFLSLQYVAVCVGTGKFPLTKKSTGIYLKSRTEMRHPHDAYYADPYEILPLFLLPNIKTLSFNWLGYATDEPDSKYSIQPGSSSVQHLSIELSDLNLNEILMLVGAAKSLKSVKGIPTTNEVTDFLLSRYADSLEVLNGCDNARKLPQFTSLKRLNLLPLPDVASVNDKEYTYTKFFKSVLPPRIEYVDIQNKNPDFKTNPEAQPHLLRALAAVVQDKRFANLRDICLFGVSKHMRAESDKNFKWDDPAALAVLAERGVRLHLPGPGMVGWDQHRREHNPKSDVLESDPCQQRKI